MKELISRLELRVPPLAVALLCAAAMWWTPGLMPLPLADPLRFSLAALLGLSGAAVSLAGVLAFRHARTTVNPTTPEATSTLVIAGIYHYTRNPMYLGFLLALIGWAAFVAHVEVLLGLALFVLYLNRFQIIPEERALLACFGEAYEEYRKQVRRWV